MRRHAAACVYLPAARRDKVEDDFRVIVGKRVEVEVIAFSVEFPKTVEVAGDKLYRNVFVPCGSVVKRQSLFGNFEQNLYIDWLAVRINIEIQG